MKKYDDLIIDDFGMVAREIKKGRIEKPEQPKKKKKPKDREKQKSKDSNR